MTNPPCIVGLGELLWDCFPEGRQAGGAPANFAYHAAALGCEGVPCSRVGADKLGDDMLEHLRSHGLPTDWVQRDDAHPTGRVDIMLEDGEPNYEFAADVAWDHLECTAGAQALAQRANVICFGTLAQRSTPSREAVHSILANASQDCLKVFDVNLRPPHYDQACIERSLQVADLVKLNHDEQQLLSEMFSLPSGDREFAQAIEERFGPPSLCVTRGGEGAMFAVDGELHATPGRSVKVVDPVGSGDSFTAALVVARLREADPESAVQFANAVGATVASHAGAMPQIADDYARLVQEFLE